MPTVQISSEELDAIRALAKAAPGLEAALEESKARVEDLKQCTINACLELDRRVNVLREDVMTRLDAIEKAVENLEWKGRKPNFLLTNLPESQDEKPQATEKKVKKFLEEKMSLNNIDIVGCHRLGKPGGVQPRRILVSTASGKQKQEVMKRRTQLRGTNHYLDDDLPVSLRERREDLRRLALPLAKRRGVRLTLSYPFIAARVGQHSYTLEELEDLEEEAEKEQIDDPREEAKAARSADGRTTPTPKSTGSQPKAEEREKEGEADPKEETHGKRRRRSEDAKDSMEKMKLKQTKIGDYLEKSPPPTKRS